MGCHGHFRIAALLVGGIARRGGFRFHDDLLRSPFRPGFPRKAVFGTRASGPYLIRCEFDSLVIIVLASNVRAVRVLRNEQMGLRKCVECLRCWRLEGWLSLRRRCWSQQRFGIVTQCCVRIVVIVFAVVVALIVVNRHDEDLPKSGCVNGRTLLSVGFGGEFTRILSRARLSSILYCNTKKGYLPESTPVIPISIHNTRMLDTYHLRGRTQPTAHAKHRIHSCPEYWRGERKR